MMSETPSSICPTIETGENFSKKPFFRYHPNPNINTMSYKHALLLSIMDQRRFTHIRVRFRGLKRPLSAKNPMRGRFLMIPQSALRTTRFSISIPIAASTASSSTKSTSLTPRSTNCDSYASALLGRREGPSSNKMYIKPKPKLSAQVYLISKQLISKTSVHSLSIIPHLGFQLSLNRRLLLFGLISRSVLVGLVPMSCRSYASGKPDSYSYADR